jgi:hypothetical protein
MNTHKHGAVVHAHEHSHVTHYLRPTEDWVHLTTSHGHEHNHSACEHAHEAHQNWQKEHAREGHVHDHGHPAQS